MRGARPTFGPDAAPIAIVAMAGLFPGGRTLEEFWATLAAGASAAREVPPGRWAMEPARAGSAVPQGAEAVASGRACLLDEIPLDTGGLDVDLQLMERLDPLCRLVLHVGGEAFRDARTEGLDRERVAVILANIALPTERVSDLARETILDAFAGAPPRLAGSRTHPLNRHVTGLPAGLLARALHLGGGVFTLDAACASSLYALKLACDELASGRADAVLAGGASRPDSLYTQMGFSQLRALSPSGRCAPFDERGDGLVVGEGAGIFVLKRLEDALSAGDRIHGVVRGAGLSNDLDGALLAPSSEGQLRAMRDAYRVAGWSPASVDLVECHGTGTPLGDAVEFASLLALRRDAGKSGNGNGHHHRDHRCAIGSVKANVGHLLTGAGAAGLAKVLLAIRERTLPPQANFERPHANVPLEGSPYEVLREPRPWERRRDDAPRRAAVSGFGFGGINAHVLIEEWDPALVSSVAARRAPRETTAEPGVATDDVGGVTSDAAVAIVGMGACFGPLGDLRQVQEALLGGSSAIGPLPPDRWRGLGGSPWLEERLGELHPFPGAYLEPLALAPGEFRIPPAELPQLLPQQLLMLSVARAALADASMLDAGKGTKRGPDPRAGVVIGTCLDLATTNFHLRWTGGGIRGDGGQELPADEVSPALNATRTLGALGGLIASRIAREFQLGGPSFAVSSEETSGMRALEVAARALARGEVDVAIAGAVDVAGDVRTVLATHALRPWSASVARPFEASADGSVPGEGAAALVLKRLDDATRDGDRIYAVLRGVGTSSTASAGTATPSPRAYALALERAYGDADVDPTSVGYLEAHGSGDPSEDALEAGALLAWRSDEREPACALGSAKAVLGHAGAAAGLASVVKAALCLYQEILPPLDGFESPCATLHGRPGPFHVPREPLPWLRDRVLGPRRAGVSSMSTEGSCLHAVLEGIDRPPSAHAVERRQPLGARPEALFAVEGNSHEDLLAGLDALEMLATGSPQAPVEMLARRWHERMGWHPTRRYAVALVAEDDSPPPGGASLAARVRDAREALLASDGPIEMPSIRFNPNPVGRDVALVFPGSGNHYAGMGRGLAVEWPEVVRALDGENQHLASQLMTRWHAPWRLDWRAGWEAASALEVAREVERAIFGQVSHGVLVADVLRELGIAPQAAIGYSLGESTALFALRAWRDRDEMLRRMKASPLFKTELAGPCRAAQRALGLDPEAPVAWRAVLVNRTAADVRAALEGRPLAFLLIVNASDECVVGGVEEEVEALVAELGADAWPLDGVPAVHCEPVVAEVAEAYRQLHLHDTTPPPGVRFYSAAAGRSYPLDRESAARSILEQALHGFDFPALVERAYADGVRVFLECGPQGSCARTIGKVLAGRPHVAVTACVRGQEDRKTILRLLARLVAERVPVDLERLYGQETRVVGHREVVPAVAGIRVPIELPEPRRAAAPVTASPAPPAAAMIAAITPPLPVPARSFEAPPRPVATVLQHAPPAAMAGAGPVMAVALATASAHDAFLRIADRGVRSFAGGLALQSRLLEAIARYDPGIGGEGQGSAPPRIDAPAASAGARAPVAFDRAACLEFARGSIGAVLGPRYAAIDAHPTRVRLPDEPLMLVDRIVSVSGEPLGLGAGRCVTEHDVHEGAWYLDGGRAPVAIAVEAGQADLFLSAYLGIDHETRGERRYRLLDAAIEFHRGLPRPGETARYEIAIDRFLKQGSTYLFFFRFDAFVGDAPLLTMRDGCAGFFSEEQLASSAGVVLSPEESEPEAGRNESFVELVPVERTSLDAAALEALRDGDLARAFGESFEGLDLADPLRLPGGRLHLVDRVVDLDPAGGRYGMGLCRAEADVHPDDWFLTCHFTGDPVMPGTLMYECCLHTLRVLLLRMGWVGEQAGVAYEPVPGVTSRLRCRGQVLPSTRTAAYEVHLKEIGYGPEPYAIADALMFADGRRIVKMSDMSVRLTGLGREAIEALWARRGRGAAGTGVVRRKPAFDRERILAFAEGKPSDAFGEPYRVFDGERRIARLPRPPYAFIDRVTDVSGARAWRLEPGAWIEAEYDVPPDAWYFRANQQRSMPFSVLLEVALQPCGWLAAYLGSALKSSVDLSFRNLGGRATQEEEVFPDAGTLTTRVTLTSVSEAAGMIVQRYDLLVRRAGRTVYEGETSFGFFSKEALAQQVGVRGARERRHVPGEDELARGIQRALPAGAPATPDDLDGAIPPGAALPARAYRMIDEVTLLVLDGGAQGKGFVRGETAVDPGSWFFQAHFYQDPVWPGSLGLESFLQLLKVLLLERRPDLAGTHRFEPVLLGRPHAWIYRGQIVPRNTRVTVEASVDELLDDGAGVVASGFLSVDGIVIYEMNGLGLRLVADGTGGR